MTGCDRYAIMLAAHRELFDEMEGPVERDLYDADIVENATRTDAACQQLEEDSRRTDGDSRGLVRR